MYRLQLFTISTLQHMHRLSNTQIVSFTNRELILLNNNLSFYKEKMIPHFSSSIWQPPKLMNLADFCMS